MDTNHNPEPIPAQDLHDLFERRRPDPEAFRAGVAKRIAERRAAEGDSNERDASGGGVTFLRKVAAVLPMDPVSGGKAGSATIKFLYAILALPALVLGSTVWSFVASMRLVKRDVQYAAPPTGERLNWRQRKIFTMNDDLLRGGQLLVIVNSGILIALFLSFATGGRTGIDILTLVLLLAMGAVVLTVRGLAKEGLLLRGEAARFCMSLLITVFTGCFLWMSTGLGPIDGHAVLGNGWASSVVLLGIVTCVALRWGWLRGVLALCAAFVLFVAFNTGAITKSTPGALAKQLAVMELDPESLRDWTEAAAIHTALETSGAPLPDMHETRERLARALEQGVDAHPVVWTAAAHMGWLDKSQWMRLADSNQRRRSMDRLLRPETPMTGSDYDEYRVPMLLACRDLSPAQREQVAQNALAAWPAKGVHGPLGDAVRLMNVFEWLERDDLVQLKAHATRELLVEHWTAPGTNELFGKVGGFTSDPEKFKTSFEDETWAAMELLLRVGVPEQIDLFWLRGNLKREARAMPLVFEPLQSHKAKPRASLLLLEREIGMPERSLFATLLSERLLIATVLLVALCMLAVRLSPADPGAEGVGAQP